VDHAHRQYLERLRHEADLAQRQFTRVDPDNRVVAAELERRWEAALRALKQAEAASAQPAQPPATLLPLPPERQARFEAVGQRVPHLGESDILTQAQKKALLRTLIDLVVVQRTAPDRVQVRIVWQGGQTSTRSVPVPVGAWTALTGAAEMEAFILEQSARGVSDEEIAAQRSAQGYRSQQAAVVLPSTVRIRRLKQHILRTRHPSHPRRVAGALRVPQLAQALDLTPHWNYDRIHNGTIQITKDPQRKIFLFPEAPETLAQFRRLQAGALKALRY
jgi:hypothetical protein